MKRVSLKIKRFGWAMLLLLLCVSLCGCSFSLEDSLKKLKAYINGEELSAPPEDFVASRTTELFAYDEYTAYTVLTGYLGEDVSVTVPAKLGGKPVRKIASLAFYDGVAIEELVVSEGITELEENALYYCTALKSVTLPQTLQKLGEKCFSWCSSLEELTLPANVTELPGFCFNQCTALHALTVRGGITSVGVRAFSGCRSLETVSFGSALTSLGDYAFRDCARLQSVALPGNCVIGDGVFTGCPEAFTVITEPDSPCWNACTEAEIPVCAGSLDLPAEGSGEESISDN